MSRNRRQAIRHGYVVIDKPAGWTSHDVVARVRRIVAERRVGHAGTLDPAATGVLPVAVGLATRTVEYLAGASKAYRAQIRFGITTDSADRDGEITSQSDPTGLTLEVIEAALASFRGEISQRPPMHSAIKVDGTRLYELARKGIVVDVEARRVVIDTLEVTDWTSPVLSLDVVCSKGTYIRSLARDLGEAVGTGAYLEALQRSQTGPFSLDDAITLEELERALAEKGWDSVCFPPDMVLGHLTRLDLDQQQVIDWGHGKRIALESIRDCTVTVRAYDGDGRWIGIGEIDEATSGVRPLKVIATE